MKNGATLVELMVFIGIVAILLSLAVPVFSDWCYKISVYAEVFKIRSRIRYAKTLSGMNGEHVEVSVSKEVRILSSKREVYRENLNFVTVSGKNTFAFSDGVPYISGTMRLFSKESLFATITVTPVVGRITLLCGW